jgi:hypothetical protein
MRRLLLAVPALVLLCPGRSASAGVDPALVGTWRGEAVPIELRIAVSGACSVGDQEGACACSGGRLRMTDRDGHASEYEYTLEDGALVLSGGEIAVPLRLQRVGGPPASASASVNGDPRPSAKGQSTPWNKESWGLRLDIPPGWKGGEKDGVLLLGSDTEAGLLIVRFFRKTTREELLAGYKTGVREQGVTLSADGEAQEIKAPAGAALAGELSGSAADGTRLRARTIAVLSPFGGAAVAMGLTTPEKFPALRARVEELWRTFRFSEPKAPNGAALLAGRFEYVYVSKNGGYSRESRITLCADGRFTKNGELAGSGSAGSAFTAHGDGGSWISEGDAENGQLVLTYGGGGAETLAYRVSHDPRDRSAFGPAVVIGNTKYQRTGNGECR